MASIATSVPGINFLGTDDKSTRQPVGTPEAMPFHRPLLFHFGEKGTTEQQYLPSSLVASTYGQAFLDPKSAFFTHSSPFVQESIDTQSRALHIRVLPEDVPNKSAMSISIDMLATDIPQYKRDEDTGMYQLDANGSLIDTGVTVKGIRGRFVVTKIDDDAKTGTSQFGRRQVQPGTIGTAGNPSTLLPICDFQANDYGDMTGVGIKLFAPTALSSTPADVDAMDAAGAYLYQLGILRRDNPLASPTKELTYTYGYDLVPVSFGQKVIDADKNAVYDIDKVVPAAWTSDDPSDPQRCSVGAVHVYRDNIEKLNAAILAAEQSFPTAPVDANFVNFIGGATTDGQPYYAYQLDDLLDGGTNFDETSAHYLRGGGTGTMNNDTFNKAVNKILSNLDGDYHFKNYARFPFNAVWDTGFDHATKMLIPSIMANRYDSWIALATQDITQPDNTPEQDASYGVAMLTRLQQFPDSVLYNTPAYRGIIHGQAADWLGSTIPVRVPQSIELFHKVCMWGRDSSGRANEENAPDAGSDNGDPVADNRVVTRTKNISNVDVSFRTKKAQWAAGIIYVEDYDTRSQFYAGIQSFYTEPTSVLRSGLVGLCFANINRYAWNAWRAFTGIQGITDDQLVDRTEKLVKALCAANISTDRMVCTPHASITKADDANGSSWTLVTDAYVSGMRTTLNASTVAYRRSDLNVSQ